MSSDEGGEGDRTKDLRSVQGTKVKDPRWLRIEVCRDFAAGKCKRKETECRFAHPSKSCILENRKLTVCYDSMKGKCTREACKFYHPPFHIKEYLLALGKALEQQRMEQERQVNLDDVEQNSKEESSCNRPSYQRSDSEPFCYTRQSGGNRGANGFSSEQQAAYLITNPVDPVYVPNSGFAMTMPPVQLAAYSPQHTPNQSTYQQAQFQVRGSISFPQQREFPSYVPVNAVNAGYERLNVPTNSFVYRDVNSYQPVVPQTVLVPVWQPVYNANSLGHGEYVPTQNVPVFAHRIYRPNSI